MLCAGAIGFSASASAEPLSFSESVFLNSDFPGSPYAITTPLDVGTNFINGSMINFQQMGFFPDGSDSFSVILPPTLAISSIELRVGSGFQNGAVNSSSGFSLLAPSSGSESFDASGTFVLSPFTISGSPIAFAVSGGVDFPVDGQLRNWDVFTYTLAIEVVVPEPSTVTLLALGLALLVGARSHGVIHSG